MIGGCTERNTRGQVRSRLVRREHDVLGSVRTVSYCAGDRPRADDHRGPATARPEQAPCGAGRWVDVGGAVEGELRGQGHQ